MPQEKGKDMEISIFISGFAAKMGIWGLIFVSMDGKIGS